jgi:hypothetical protein
MSNPTPAEKRTVVPPEGIHSTFPVEVQLKFVYSDFQRQMLTLGKQVNDLWQRAWTDRLATQFGIPVAVSGAYLRVAAGTPPDHAPKLVEALAQTGHKVVRIELDQITNEFRLYTSPK